MNPDDLLYHYTNAEALLGILGRPGGTPEIWLTQIQYMNDEQEWWHAFDLMRDAGREMRDDPRASIKELANLFLPKDQEQYRQESREWGPVQRSFVFSLSEERDLLSQWRGYTPLGGYSVGFRFGDLQTIAQGNGFRLIKCVYKDNEKKRLIESLLAELDGDMVRGDISAEVASVDQPKEKLPLKSAYVKMQRKFSEFATYFKHDSFCEEKEWRIVGVVPAGGNDPRERWRTRRDQILPYAALPLNQFTADSFPVKTIITGPGVDYQLAEHSVRFLRYSRVGSINVTRSKSTLRR